MLIYAIYDVTRQYLRSLANQCHFTFSVYSDEGQALWDKSVMINVSKFVGI